MTMREAKHKDIMPSWLTFIIFHYYTYFMPYNDIVSVDYTTVFVYRRV